MLAVARELFYWRGIHAVGVDTIAAEAEIAPTTLYRLFGSKDGLVAAYVEREAAGHREWFERALGDPARPPDARLIDLFGALSELVRPEICRGCPFQMALAETPDENQRAHAHAVELKRWVRERFGGLAREHLASDQQAELLADQLMMLYDGAFATAASLGAGGPPASLRAIATQLLSSGGG